ncbi:restriction endonuclease subunit S [Campylobacter upsaliensis]|nr:restriction endonuclease subunit S [Campylobacter upsaliensis]
MKTDTLKKSLLDYAIKGRLSAKFRRENSELSAFDELEIYNDKIREKRKNLEKELKTLESKLKKAPTRHCETSAGSRGKTSEAVQGVAEAGFFSNPQTKHELKSQIQSLKKELTKCKEIIPLMTMDCHEVANATSHNDDLGYSSSSLRGEAEANHTPKTANRLPQVSSETLAMTTTPPFEIPNSWAWVKLGDICEIFTGDSINATEKEKNFTHQTSGLNYIATKDLANDTSITYENGIKIPDEFLPSFKIAKANSTLLCIEGGSAGRKVGFLKENVCFGNKLCCFENIFAFSKFVFYFLQSGEFSKEFNSNINGIIGGVKKESIRHFLIPLPPLREQQEIVKKLDLLVSLANDFAIIKENLKRI